MSFEPSDSQVALAVGELREARPEASAKFLLKVIRIKYPNWQLSETRLKKFTKSNPAAGQEQPPSPSPNTSASSASSLMQPRPIIAPPPRLPDRGFTMKPKSNGRFVIRQNGIEIDCSDSTGKWWDGLPPAAWVTDASGCFDVRIQTAGSNNPIMVSTECKQVAFQVDLMEGTGLRDLFTMISRYPDFGGRMAYFSARVTAPHTLFVFSDRIFTRNWDDASSQQRQRQAQQQRPPIVDTVSSSITSPPSPRDVLSLLPAAASATMSRLADSHYGLREQVVAETCRPKHLPTELQRLQAEGTDIARNDADPLGDGDQSPIRNDGTGCHHSTLWAAGGNLLDLVEQGDVPPIVIHFLSGNVSEIRAALEGARADGRVTELLESRFGLLRSTPLMLVVTGCGQDIRSVDRNLKIDFFETMRLLLEAGARVDARDLCGKTVLHYLVGPLFKEPQGWDMLRACIETSSQLQLQPPLVDVRDRFGVTVVTYAVMMNLTSLVKVLCEDYHADTTIADWAGISAHSFLTLNGDIKKIIVRASGRTIAALDTCCVCKAPSAKHKCAGCKVVRYCSPQCQTNDWAQHSLVCLSKTEVDENVGFVMRPSLGKHLATMSKSVTVSAWNGLLPPSVKLDGKGFFEIKVQIAGPSAPMMVYSRHKDVCFTVGMHQGDNLPALHAKIAAWPAYSGAKAYFFAKLVGQGELFVSGKQMFARDW
jgi:hypothetical protein